MALLKDQKRTWVPTPTLDDEEQPALRLGMVACVKLILYEAVSRISRCLLRTAGGFRGRAPPDNIEDEEQPVVLG